MKLVKAQVLNFRSVEDSGVFEIGDLTCLGGRCQPSPGLSSRRP